MAKRAELRTGRGTSLTIRAREQAWAVKSMAKKVGTRTPEIIAGEKIFTAITLKEIRLRIATKEPNTQTLLTAKIP